MIRSLISWLFGLAKPKSASSNDEAEFRIEGTRSGSWHYVSSSFLANKKCAVCGGTADLQAHHKKPFHKYPELELEVKNLIPLCGYKGKNCHFIFGHLMNWAMYNHDLDNTIEYFQLLRKTAKIRAGRHG